MGWVVLWALPGSWEHLELMAPDLDERVATRVGANAAGAGLGPKLVDDLVAGQIDLAHQARDAGVLVWAGFGEGAGTLDDPLSALSLTLAVGELPATGRRAEPGSGNAGTGSMPALTPLVLEDPELIAYVQERRSTVHLPGADGDLAQFQAQVFLACIRARLVLVLTVTTADPAREDQARAVAREVATTITTVEVETEAA